MILGLIVCIVFLFVTLTSMERRMASVESELKENSKKGTEHNLPENEKKGSLSSARYRRNADLKANFSDLTKRLEH